MMYEGEDYKKEKRFNFRKRGGRFVGERTYYFVLHNLISVLLFFSLANGMGLFEKRTQFIQDLFTIDFINLFIYVFALLIFTGLIARGIAYFTLYMIIVRWRKKEMKRIGEINTGIDSINLNYIIANLIGAILFSLGAIVILQELLFNNYSIISLFLSYLIMKAGVYGLIKVFNNVR